jgi:hypothetical protein
MSEVLEIRLRPGDDAGHDRLRDIFNLQASADRMARWRHVWTAVVVAASIPIALCAAQPGAGRSLATWSLSIWATALLSAVGCGGAEVRARRRLRDLLACR